jgi:hemerythrin-like metal-binding protein
MVNLDWHDKLLTGVDKLDDDHKHVLEIMRELQQRIEKQDYDPCSALFADLLAAGAAHFEYEEAYLAKANYPYIEEHIQFHHDLVLKVKNVKAICETPEKRDELKSAFDIMAEFLKDDVIAGDQQFKSYLESRGLVR